MLASSAHNHGGGRGPTSCGRDFKIITSDTKVFGESQKERGGLKGKKNIRRSTTTNSGHGQVKKI